MHNTALHRERNVNRTLYINDMLLKSHCFSLPLRRTRVSICHFNFYSFKHPHRSTSSATKQYNTAWTIHAITLWYSLHRGHPQTSTKIRSRKWKHLEFPALNRRALLPTTNGRIQTSTSPAPKQGGKTGPQRYNIKCNKTIQHGIGGWILHAITLWYSLHRGHPQTSTKIRSRKWKHFEFPTLNRRALLPTTNGRIQTSTSPASQQGE